LSRARAVPLLLLLFFLLAAGCAPLSPPGADEPDIYREKPITPARYFRYLRYKRSLGPPLPGAPEVPVVKQSILSNTCGVSVIKSVGDYFKTPWDKKEIAKAVLGTHPQGTSVSSIVEWFESKGYSRVVLHSRDYSIASLMDELKSGCLVVALIYSFRDGYGPNHFVVVTMCDGERVNVVDSRIGAYSEPASFFMSRSVLVLGTWIAVRR